MSVRVLVADDQELVRTGLRMILDAQPDIEVVGEAADGREAVALARELRPDVCLFDVRMPELDGIEATRLLARFRHAQKLSGLPLSAWMRSSRVKHTKRSLGTGCGRLFRTGTVARSNADPGVSRGPRDLRFTA